jgi:hypothetical protein
MPNKQPFFLDASITIDYPIFGNQTKIFIQSGSNCIFAGFFEGDQFKKNRTKTTKMMAVRPKMSKIHMTIFCVREDKCLALE